MSSDLFDCKVKSILKNYGYQISKKLNEGGFGEVFQAINPNLKNPECVVKVIDTRKLNDRAKYQFVPAELMALMDVKHRYVIRVYDIFRYRHNIYIFMEEAGQGDLAGYVRKHKMLNEPLAAVWFHQISLALHYLHIKQRIAHRDLKCENVLLDKNYNTRLTDFGFAFIGDKTDIYLQTSCQIVGSVPYFAPQLAARKPYNPFCSDVWALAVLLYALLCNRFPFNFKNGYTTLYKEQCNYPQHIRSRFLERNSDQAKDIMERMLEPDEKKRLKIGQVLQHEWLNCGTNEDNIEMAVSSDEAEQDAN